MAEPSDARSEANRPKALVLGLIGSGHALSHFYLLTLAPLFPLLQADLGVSYFALGWLITAFNISTGALQTPAGFLVDRLGARRLLMGGTLLSAVCFAGMAVAPDYWTLLALVGIAGLGNAVYHPADYSILSASIDRRWIGRAFSIHTFSGHLGFAIAPPVAGFLALTLDLGWRGALAGAAVAGMLVYLFFAWKGHVLRDDTKVAGDGTGTQTDLADSVAMLASPPVLVLFLFFVSIAMVTAGMQSWSVTALGDHQGLDLETAGLVLSAFLWCGAFGVLLGGQIADRTARHGLVAGAAMVAGAVVLAVIAAVPLHWIALLVLFGAIGLMQGAVRPARDMMVRAVAPEGATGRIFAFVMTGLNVGAAITPPIFGWLIDIGRADLMFWALSGLMLASLATIGVVRGGLVARVPAAVPVAAPGGDD